MSENILNFYKKINVIQASLNAPKSKYNSFGKYKYRNCEDILEGFKALGTDLVLILSDEIVQIGDRTYIKATALITDGVNSVSNTSFARESLTKKGMDESQITGAASSYARKYAMNGLLMIDDNQDADSMSPVVAVHPDVAAINKAITSRDSEFIKSNWSGLIARSWTSLTESQTMALNSIMNG